MSLPICAFKTYYHYSKITLHFSTLETKSLGWRVFFSAKELFHSHVVLFMQKKVYVSSCGHIDYDQFFCFDVFVILFLNENLAIMIKYILCHPS